MAGMAAAAGPIGAVIVAAVIAVKALNDAAMGAVRSLGNLATMAADPDANPAKVIGAAGDGMKSFGDKVLICNPALGILAGVAGEATSSLAKFMDAVNATAGRYGEYNAQIQQSAAMAEVKHTMGDIRRAQEAAPELAGYLTAQVNLQQKFEDIKIKILNKILPLVTTAVNLLEAIMPSGKGIEGAIGVLAAPLNVLASVMKLLVQLQDENRVMPNDPTSVITGLDANGQPNIHANVGLGGTLNPHNLPGG